MNKFPRIYGLAWESVNTVGCELQGHVIGYKEFPVSNLPSEGRTLFRTPVRGSKKVSLVCSDSVGNIARFRVRGAHSGLDQKGDIGIGENDFDR